MVHSEYIKFQTTDRQFLDHVAEEAAEFLTAYAKMQRWGEDSVNPEVPVEEEETNIDWVHRELDDLEGAVERYRARIKLLPQTGETVPDVTRNLTIHPFRNMNGMAAAAVISGQSGNCIGYIFYDFYKGWWYAYTRDETPMLGPFDLDLEVVDAVRAHYNAVISRPVNWWSDTVEPSRL